jgi:mannobiose 2-epimerase
MFVIGCTSSFEMSNPKILEEMEKSLRHELLDAWYPISVDTVYGGFLSDFTFDWQPKGFQNKFLVSQARHVWTTSEAALFFNNDNYRKIAEQGFHFLRDKMWDSRYGGFFMLRNRQGDPIQGGYDTGKSAYGNAFAIYALTVYYKMSGDTSALNLAQRTFFWLEKHGHDPEYNGYFDRMNRDGSWYDKSKLKFRSRQLAGACWKDQNSSIHLLEAFTKLYRIWPDILLRERLREMLTLIRDTITTEKGYLTLFLERDWTPVSFRDSSAAVREANSYFDHVSFGHDVETAYLMLEASHALRIKLDTKTLIIAKKMVDHALTNGWDAQNGGFYFQGYYFNHSSSISIMSDKKIWWVQDEGLNALLLMARLFPNERKYEDAFKKQWEYMKKYLIDHEHGGWYMEGLDKSPEKQQAPKAFDWKANYHDVRALMNCIKMLKSEHELLK